MAVNLFDQFSSPVLLGIPLSLISLFVPWLILISPDNRLVQSRTSTILAWTLKSFTKQIFLPLSPSGQKWALMLSSLMSFLLLTNLLGLLPYTFTPTTQLSLNLGLAVPIWLSTVLIGLRNRLSSTIAHLLPEGTPAPLIPALTVIETISLLIRPLALGVRLTANLTAGHLLIHLTSVAAISLFFTPILSAPTFITLLLLTLLEIAVAMIQAYVFVLLTSLYLQENT